MCIVAAEQQGVNFAFFIQFLGGSNTVAIKRVYGAAYVFTGTKDHTNRARRDVFYWREDPVIRPQGDPKINTKKRDKRNSNEGCNKNKSLAK